MKNKQELLADIQEGLRQGVITDADLTPLLRTPPSQPAAAPRLEAPAHKPDKLSAVDVMFYIAGIVLFSAIMSVIVQSWEDGNAIVHILLSAGVGLGMWSVAYLLIASAQQSDVRKGLTNSLLLTGSLSVITGGYIITNELFGAFNEINFIPGAIMLAVVGALHIGFDRLIKKDITLLTGILLCVASFPALLFGLIQKTDVPMDVWSVILILSAGLLAYATRVVAKAMPDRHALRTSYDPLAAFLGLAAMYASSFGDYDVVWLGALVVGVLGIFYLSIISQNKHLLGNASFFLVLTVITLSFRYFSGYGVTTSLILATMGLLGSAAIASGINKKYFKQPPPTTLQDKQ